jgi:hypothetical protein
MTHGTDYNAGRVEPDEISQEQLEIAGTEVPASTKIPAIDTALQRWLRREAEAKAAVADKTAAHEALTELGVARVAYVDAGGRKRHAFADLGKPRIKTAAAPGEKPKRGRSKRSKADDVEHRKVPRTAEHDRAADPFGATRSVLDEARERQSAADRGEQLAPPDSEPKLDKPKKPKPEKFDLAMLADGRCALRFDGGNACSQEAGHAGLHKSSTHSWKARRPKPPTAEAMP